MPRAKSADAKENLMLAPHFACGRVYAGMGALGFRVLFKSFLRFGLIAASGLAFSSLAGDVVFENPPSAGRVKILAAPGI